jgi:hypothetical protein
MWFEGQRLANAIQPRHIEKHPIAIKHQNDIPYLLNNPDLITPNHEEPETHIFYKVFYGKLLLAIPVHLKNQIRFIASMYKAPYIKGLKQRRLTANQFLYIRGGFQWKIRLAGGVVEFIFGPATRISFGDEDQPSLEIGRDGRSKKIVAFMCLHFPALHERILRGLKEKPITQKFSVEAVEDYEKKNFPFATRT